jgi:hypothetical protein
VFLGLRIYRAVRKIPGFTQTAFAITEAAKFTTTQFFSVKLFSARFTLIRNFF